MASCFLLQTLTLNSWGQPGHQWNQTAGWCHTWWMGCWGSSFSDAPHTSYTLLENGMGWFFLIITELHLAMHSCKLLLLTLHTLINRLIIGVCSSFWSFGRLNQQNCVRLKHKRQSSEPCRTVVTNPVPGDLPSSRFHLQPKSNTSFSWLRKS